MSLYVDKTKGVLTKQQFLRMTETLEQEQTNNKLRMQEITDELWVADSAEDDVWRFIGGTWEYASITELDEEILNWLIDKIIISAVEVIDGEKVQEVCVIYNLVGGIKVASISSVYKKVNPGKHCGAKALRSFRPNGRQIVALVEKRLAELKLSHFRPVGLFFIFSLMICMSGILYFFHNCDLVVVVKKPIFEPSPLAHVIEKL